MLRWHLNKTVIREQIWSFACCRIGMDPNMDLAKLVGAASAPVALIIASCIYLGNLTQKYNSLFQQIRRLSSEIREGPDSEERRNSIHQQLQMYEKRIRGAMRCAFLLNIAIILFVLTVLFTGVSMLLPGNIPMMITTAGVMCLGLLVVILSVVVELLSNRLARPTLDLELTSGTPEYEPVYADKA
jgi:hypothetical protein